MDNLIVSRPASTLFNFNLLFTLCPHRFIIFTIDACLDSSFHTFQYTFHSRDVPVTTRPWLLRDHTRDFQRCRPALILTFNRFTRYFERVLSTFTLFYWFKITFFVPQRYNSFRTRLPVQNTECQVHPREVSARSRRTSCIVDRNFFHATWIRGKVKKLTQTMKSWRKIFKQQANTP